MKKFLAAGIAALALTVGIAPAAHSKGSPGCVSKTEFQSVRMGHGRKTTHLRFETIGKQTSIYVFGGTTLETREYKACSSKYGFVSVSYENTKVEYKAAYWG